MYSHHSIGKVPMLKLSMAIALLTTFRWITHTDIHTYQYIIFIQCYRAVKHEIAMKRYLNSSYDCFWDAVFILVILINTSSRYLP